MSPVADSLRKILSEVNWARAGLGLPLLEEKKEKRPEFTVPAGPRPQPEGESVVPSHKSMTDGSLGAIPKYTSSPMVRSSISKDAAMASSSMTSPLLRDTAALDMGSPGGLGRSDDTDDNKYKRRSAVSWLVRWWKSVMGPSLFGKN